MLGLAKKDFWGLEAESWFLVASLPFAKMIPHASALRPKSFANPNVHASEKGLMTQNKLSSNIKTCMF